MSLCRDLLSLNSWQMEDFSGEKNGHFTVNHFCRKNHLYHQVSAVSGRRSPLGKVVIPWTDEQHWQTAWTITSHSHNNSLCSSEGAWDDARTSIINKFLAAAAVMPEVLLQALALHPLQDDVYCCCPALAYFLFWVRSQLHHPKFRQMWVQWSDMGNF